MVISNATPLRSAIMLDCTSCAGVFIGNGPAVSDGDKEQLALVSAARASLQDEIALGKATIEPRPKIPLRKKSFLFMSFEFCACITISALQRNISSTGVVVGVLSFK